MELKRKVFVGLSGGVDSSVAAARLLTAGCDVTGVFIKVWHPDFLVCNWEQERVDAMRVAAHLGIPFLTCDATATYRDEVAKYFIESYKAGITPNPDVMCNKEVKFGAFLTFAKKHGADFVATGHYAQVEHVDGNTSVLRRGIDKNKDQSYFLWSLTNQQLSKALFPVGNSPKDLIREEAQRLQLPTAQKKDSQGVCFLGHIDIPDFLSHYIDLQPGDVYSDQGKTIGRHRGAFVYTIGQRHGFTIHTSETDRSSYYVIHKNIESNTITVSTTPPSVAAGSDIVLERVVLRQSLAVGQVLNAQVRYRQEPFTVTVMRIDTNTVTLKTFSRTDRPSSGQSCVLYNGMICIGGGIIIT